MERNNVGNRKEPFFMIGSNIAVRVRNHQAMMLRSPRAASAIVFLRVILLAQPDV